MNRYTFLSAVLISVNARAFDIDGFRTGMSQEKVVARAQMLGLEITSERTDYVLAQGDGRHYSLSFCKNFLVTAQKIVDPTFDTFVELASYFQSLYGAPVSVMPQTPDPTSYAPSYTLSIAWRAKSEVITVDHTSFKSNTQTDVTYDAPNSCFQNPLLQ
jgi:hypothetical protein